MATSQNTNASYRSYNEIDETSIELSSWFGARRGWVVNATPRPLYSWERAQVLILQEGGWDPGPIWTGVENLGSTGIRSPDRAARNESLYQLRYSGPTVTPWKAQILPISFTVVPVQTVKAYEWVEVDLSSFLTSALEAGEK